jgi:hypothetical protein
VLHHKRSPQISATIELDKIMQPWTNTIDVQQVRDERQVTQIMNQTQMEPALAFAPVDVNAFGKVAGMPDDFQTG